MPNPYCQKRKATWYLRLRVPVVVSGDEEFRAKASRELIRRGVEVLDCPLSWDEQEALRSEFRVSQEEEAPATAMPR